MGMFDDIRYEMPCPECGVKVDGFQSKDGPCNMDILDFWEVRNFYAPCPCGAWIEFNLKPPPKPYSIDDYEMVKWRYK